MVCPLLVATHDEVEYEKNMTRLTSGESPFSRYEQKVTSRRAVGLPVGLDWRSWSSVGVVEARVLVWKHVERSGDEK